jgi:predicted MFS family arabinose efflux permease
MPAVRTVLVALVAGFALGAYLQAWAGWPTFLAVAIGALMVVLVLLIAASLGDDDAAADAAWRAAAPDLAGRDPGPGPAEAGRDGSGREVS